MPFKFLYDINKSAAEELINTYPTIRTKRTKLIFPTYSGGTIRVSEQELRFAFAAFIEKQEEYFYGVEVPTAKKYKFSGKGCRSASSDMALYENISSTIPNLRIEFKSNQPEQGAIDKDIEKLTTEPCNGAYCHIIEAENSGTLQAVFKKLSKGILKSLKTPKSSGITKPLYFSFLILNSRKLITLNMAKVAMTSSLSTYYSNLFDTTLSTTLSYIDHHNGLSVGTHFVKDWQIDIF